MTKAMMKRVSMAIYTSILAMSLTLAVPALPARADGGGHGSKANAVETPPPPPVKAGKVTVRLVPGADKVVEGPTPYTVRLTDDTGKGVKGAEVTVTITEPGHTGDMSGMDMDASPASKDIQFTETPEPGVYSGKPDFTKGGSWEVDVAFMAGDLMGSTEFKVEVASRTMNPFLLAGLLFVASFTGILAMGRLLAGVAGKDDLLKYRPVRWVFESRWFPGIFQAATGVVFAFIVWELMVGPGEAHDNFGTAMTWVLWWPLIPLLFLFLGRFWCAVCPFATLSDLVQKVVGSNKPVPVFLKRYGIWIIDAVFILITWSDHTLGIVENPRGSGILLLLLVLGVVVTGALYERRTWCRYLCFLGGLSGNYSRTGALELLANPETCAGCTVQACYKGGPKAPGCPMFEFPRTMDTSARCNLCGYCIKNCPNGSIRLGARVPTKELWGIRKPKFEEAFLSAVIMGIVFTQNITMLQVWKPILAWMEGLLGTTSYYATFTVLFAVMMALPIGALFLASLLSGIPGKKGMLKGFTVFGYALIPLDLAGHLAHNLFHLLAEGKSILYTGLALFGVESHGSAGLVGESTIQALQYFLVLLGTAGSMYTAYRMAESRKGEGWNPVRTALPVIILVAVLGALNLLLFHLPMDMRM